MRSLLVLIDGLGDDPIPALQGRTPFEYASHPVMDEVAATGGLGQISICEQDIVPESCSCILRLLGVDKRDMPQNRAYLELLAHGRDISEYEMVLRCNLAAVDASGRLVGFNAPGLTVAQMQEAYPDLAIDGEMQLNFALDKELRDEKYPFTRIKGMDVNTLIFPNLSAANTSYKMIKNLAEDAEVIGPIQMGLNKPIHFTDFESSVRDIVNITAIAVLDAFAQHLRP